MNFLTIDGSGDPNSSEENRQAIEALFGLSYILNFMVKRSGGIDYRVMPLDGLWWVDGLSQLDIKGRDN